jgi:hypothetical protein
MLYQSQLKDNRMDEEKIKKSPGRKKGSGTANTRLLRVFVTPRQDHMLTKIREEIGYSDSEATRRALDDYIDKLIARGELVDDRKPVARTESD